MTKGNGSVFGAVECGWLWCQQQTHILFFWLPFSPNLFNAVLIKQE